MSMKERMLRILLIVLSFNEIANDQRKTIQKMAILLTKWELVDCVERRTIGQRKDHEHRT